MIGLFLLGSCLGSFFILVGSRSYKKESIIRPDSHCTTCQKSLSWFELIPVISWILLRGRCQNCGVNIPKSYVILECLSGLMMIVSLTFFNGIQLVMMIGVFFLVVTLVARKLEKKISTKSY